MANGACLACEKLSCVCDVPRLATDSELRTRLEELETWWSKAPDGMRKRSGYRVDLEAFRRAVRGLK